MKQENVEPILESGVAAVIAAAEAMPTRETLDLELEYVEAASGRGYFLPDEEEFVRRRFSRFLGLRAALLGTLGELGGIAGRGSLEWRDRLPVFVTAFAAACVLMRANRFLVDLAAERPVVWKKLDEVDTGAGVPPKMFTAIYKAISDPVNAQRFLLAADFYAKNRGQIQDLADDSVVGPVVALLADEEMWIERRRDALKRIVSYRWFSFLRRNRSAWKKVMFGFFEASGRAVADLRQPGVKPHGAPKRITPALRNAVLPELKPGDMFVTRHDDALSNLFLPGFWPHAALYLGTSLEMRGLGIEISQESDGPWFLESKKDGVRVRLVDETLHVDSFVVLRSPLELENLAEGMRRALNHVGKPYDFSFDFRTADRVVCTEVIYRGFHGIGPLRFQLREVGGRRCLPAEELLSQALNCGFHVVATGGIGGDHLLVGLAARRAFDATRT